MLLVCPSSDEVCIPVRIAEGPGTPGTGLGGRPPRGVSPPRPALRYFATLPLSLEPPLFVSVFVADLEQIMGVRARVNDVGLVYPVIHPLAQRERSASEFESGLSEHSLVLLPPAEDQFTDDEGRSFPRPDHKIGGRPHLVRLRSELLASLESIQKQGHRLVGQFDFPAGEDALVSGDWPFADGMFALFGREPFGPADWAWYWDF